MAIKIFHLLGDLTSLREIDIGVPRDMEHLQLGIAAEYTIVKPQGTLRGHVQLLA